MFDVLTEIRALRSEIAQLREEVLSRKAGPLVTGKQAAKMLGISWPTFRAKHLGQDIDWIPGHRKLLRTDVDKIKQVYYQ